jgi:enoyl-[acyl-carrier protein] reductase III
MYPELKDRIALVTGATRGFGRAIALHLAGEGVQVIINYRRSKPEALAVVEEIEQMGGSAVALRADVGKEEKLDIMFKQIREIFGRLDILVANAAFGAPGKLLEATRRHWDITMNASAYSLLSLAQRAVPLMAKGGHIVSITSEGARLVLPGYGVVGPAKGALEAITRTLAVELAPRGILVNGVMAGLADTKSFKAIAAHDQVLEEVRSRTPVGRNVTPEDVARVVTFLTSDQASMICGHFVMVDGGRNIAG